MASGSGFSSDTEAALDPTAGTVIVVGSINADLVVTAPRIVRAGETISGSDFRTGQGGKGANQASAAASAGARVTMVARTGDDAHGRDAVVALDACGVDTTHITPVDAPTGVALIQVDARGENAITVVAGANALLSPHDVDAAFDALAPGLATVLSPTFSPAFSPVPNRTDVPGAPATFVRNGTAVSSPVPNRTGVPGTPATFVRNGTAKSSPVPNRTGVPGETGTSVRFGTGRGGSTRTVVAPCLEIPLPTVVHAARAAHRRGWTVVLNPAPAPAPAPDGALPAELLEAVDLIVPNEHEAAALGIAPGDRSDARDAPTVLITRGARGATLFIDGSQHEVAAPSVRPVDTTGAGDAFIGVLTASLAHGDDLLDAARRAVVGGAIATLGEGARGALPTASAIDRLL